MIGESLRVERNVRVGRPENFVAECFRAPGSQANDSCNEPRAGGAGASDLTGARINCHNGPCCRCGRLSMSSQLPHADPR